MIQKKQAQKTKSGKKTKDHTKKKFSTGHRKRNQTIVFINYLKKKFCTKLTEADEYLEMEAHKE
ncbi:hypothetical protein CW704_04475 [Candidatus Bathyarchaeota archaeon]|nr:MAG: hypothetical protein CW704_04475 [Candidatus Bathyarchaeota archaeon]